MRLLSILFVILALTCSLQALGDELVSIGGEVYDFSTRKPLPNATVSLAGKDISTATNEGGEFVFVSVPGGKIELIATSVGYKQARKVLMIGTGSVDNIILFLEPTFVEVDGITVTATRISEDKFASPTSVSITPRSKFSERSFSTTAEVLREEPGVLVQKTTYGHGAPILRGLIGKHVLLLYNGIRLNKPTFRFGANQYMNTVNLESLAKIEVVRGPSSVMYGSDAIGGAVNLIPTYHAPSNVVMVRPLFSSRYSSADNGRNLHFEVAGTYDRVAAEINGSYKKIEDLRAGERIGEQSPTGWEETDFGANVSYLLSDKSRLRADYIAVRQDDVPRYDKYASGDYEQYIYDPQNRDLYALTLDSRMLSSLIHTLKLNISYQFEKEGITQRKSGSSSISKTLDKISTWGGYAHASSFLSSRHWLSVGFEYYQDKVNSDKEKFSNGTTSIERPTFPDNSKYRSLGIFISDEYAVKKNLKLTAGARFSYFAMESPLEEPFGYFDESYDDITGSLSLSYEVNPELNLIGRWSRGFRAPSLNDAVVLKVSSSGVDAPSTDLRPEYSNNYEIGAKFRNRYTNGSLFLFYNQLTDLIDRTPGLYDGKTFFDEDGDGIQDPDEFDIYQRKNVDRSRVYGFEFENTFVLSRMWEAKGNCFWTFGESQSDHEPLSRIPPFMGMIALRMKPTDRAWVEMYARAASAQRRLSQRDIDDTRIDENGTPAWGTVNLRSQVKFSDFTLSAGFENITDATYQEHGSGIYSPGRNFTIGITYER